MKIEKHAEKLRVNGASETERKERLRIMKIENHAVHSHKIEAR